MSIQQKLKDFEIKQQELYKELELSLGKECKKILENTNIKSYTFTAYTPYFMDGEECTYSVNADWGDFNNEDENFELSENDQKAADKLITLLNSIPDAYFLNTYGDHIEITIFNNGEIKTTHYEHD